jgi:hypothetical protein
VRHAGGQQIRPLGGSPGPVLPQTVTPAPLALTPLGALPLVSRAPIERLRLQPLQAKGAFMSFDMSRYIFDS